jgi:hypothetical protein
MAATKSGSAVCVSLGSWKRGAPATELGRCRAVQAMRSSSSICMPPSARSSTSSRQVAVVHGSTWGREAKDLERRTGDVVASLGDLGIADRSMFWNTEFVEALELENYWLRLPSSSLGGAPHRDPRRPCARGLPRARRRQLVEAHARLARRSWERTARLSPRSPLRALQRVKTRRTLTPARGMINGLNLQHFPGLGRGSRSAPILPPRIMPVFALKSAR